MKITERGENNLVEIKREIEAKTVSKAKRIVEGKGGKINLND